MIKMIDGIDFTQLFKKIQLIIAIIIIYLNTAFLKFRVGNDSFKIYLRQFQKK